MTHILTTIHILCSHSSCHRTNGTAANASTNTKTVNFPTPPVQKDIYQIAKAMVNRSAKLDTDVPMQTFNLYLKDYGLQLKDECPFELLDEIFTDKNGYSTVRTVAYICLDLCDRK
jgi:hypothetical protein